MTKEKATTREKLLICAIMIAFLSLNIVLGSFFSRSSWSPAVVTAAASYLIVFIVVAAAAGIRVLYRDWKTPPRHAVGHPAATLPANLAGPAPTPARAQPSSRERPAPPTPPGNFATIDGAIAHAQQSGFAIVNLFTTYTPLSRFRDAVGAEIIYLVLSHIAEIDKFASTTVSGAATDTDCTLAIRVISTEADTLAQRPMGEIRALAESHGGTMDTNAQAGTWTLSVHLPLGESPPA